MQIAGIRAIREMIAAEVQNTITRIPHPDRGRARASVHFSESSPVLVPQIDKYQRKAGAYLPMDLFR